MSDYGHQLILMSTSRGARQVVVQLVPLDGPTLTLYFSYLAFRTFVSAPMVTPARLAGLKSHHPDSIPRRSSRPV